MDTNPKNADQKKPAIMDLSPNLLLPSLPPPNYHSPNGHNPNLSMTVVLSSLYVTGTGLPVVCDGTVFADPGCLSRISNLDFSIPYPGSGSLTLNRQRI